MSEGTSMHFGRVSGEWDALTTSGHLFLVEQARLGRLTSYTELNTVLGQRTNVRTFDFDLDSERAAMGELLGAINERERSASGLMISALVIYLNENDAGPGFYKLAEHNGDLPQGATADERLQFWSGEVRRVHEYYRRPRRH